MRTLTQKKRRKDETLENLETSWKPDPKISIRKRKTVNGEKRGSPSAK